MFDKTMKLPLFSGKTEDWPIWSEKFLVRAKRKGYKDLLLGKIDIPKDSDVGTTDAEKKEVTATKEEDLGKKFRRSLSKQEGCWNVPTGMISHDQE